MPVTTRKHGSSSAMSSSGAEMVYVRSRHHAGSSLSRTGHTAVSSGGFTTSTPGGSDSGIIDVGNIPIESTGAVKHCDFHRESVIYPSTTVECVPKLTSSSSGCRRVMSWLSMLMPQRLRSASWGGNGHIITDHRTFNVNGHPFLSHIEASSYPYVLQRDWMKIITEEIIKEKDAVGLWKENFSIGMHILMGKIKCVCRELLVLLPPSTGACENNVAVIYKFICASRKCCWIFIGAKVGFFQLNVGEYLTSYCKRVLHTEADSVLTGEAGNFEADGKALLSLEKKFMQKLIRLESEIVRLSDRLERGLKEERVVKPPKEMLLAQHRVESNLGTLAADMDGLKADLKKFKEEMGVTRKLIVEQDLVLQNHSHRFALLPSLPCECPTFPDFSGEHPLFDDDDLDTRIQAALRKYDSDKTGLADFALESGGASLLSVRCTETYPHKTRVITFFGIPLFYKTYSPRKVLQPGTLPGECWAFKGSVGSVVIKLSGVVNVSAVSYEHTPKSIAPDGHIESAPKYIEVYGLMTKNDKQPVLFGSYTYEDNGQPLQYFRVQAKNVTAVPIVEFKVLRNHGHPAYTCLYRIRVHGRRFKPVYGQANDP